MACATFDGIITAMSSGGSSKGFQEYGSVSDPFDFVSTKSASVDRLKRWRQAALVLNSSRRFRYTLDLKKEEEKKRIAEKIRTHAQVIRAAFLYQAHGEKPDGKPLQTGTPEAHPSPIPTGNLNENSEQLASMTRDHNFSVLQNFGEEKVSTKMLKTKFDKGIDDVELNKSVGKYVFGSNTYPQKKAAQFFQTHGEKPDGKPLQTGTSEAHPSPIPTGNYNVESEQLTCMTTDHNLSVSQNFGGEKGTAEILKTNHDKGIDDDVLNKSVRKYVFGSNTYPQKKVRRNMANLHYDSNTLRSRVGENARSAHPRDWMFGDNFGKWVAFIGTYCTTSAMLLAFIALKFSGTLSSYETYGWFLIASIVAHATTITTSWLKFYTANDLRNPMKENLSLVCNKILNSVFWFSAIISHLSLLLVIILPHKIIWVGYAVLCPLFVVIFVLSKMSSPNSPTDEITPTRKTRGSSSSSYRPQFEVPLYSPPAYHYQHMLPMYPSYPVQPGYQPHPMQPMQPMPPNTSSPPMGNDDAFLPFEYSPERVPETQFSLDSDTEEDAPQPTKAKAKAKAKKPSKKGAEKGKAPIKSWTPEEVILLAKTWVDISEDAVTGKDQDKKMFWRRVTIQFNNQIVGEANKRKKDSIYSKWQKENPRVMAFNDIYNNVKRTWQSGADNDQIVAKALHIYKSENKQAFGSIDFWNIVKDNAKWKMVDTVEDYIGGDAKRARTSESDYTTSDGRVNFDLNIEDPDDVPKAYRPSGREANKSSSQGKGKGVGALEVVREGIMGLSDKIGKFLASHEESRREKREARREQNETRQLKILMQDISHLTGEELELAKAAREKIKKKLNL